MVSRWPSSTACASGWDCCLWKANEDGYDDLGRQVDTLFLQQLMPELAETLAQYDAVIFVDAHIGIYPDMIRRVPVVANPDRAIVSHHVKPAGLLEIARRLCGRAPTGELISIRGFDFDFGTELTSARAEATEQVAGETWERVTATSSSALRSHRLCGTIRQN